MAALGLPARSSGCHTQAPKQHIPHSAHKSTHIAAAWGRRRAGGTQPVAGNRGVALGELTGQRGQRQAQGKGHRHPDTAGMLGWCVGNVEEAGSAVGIQKTGIFWSWSGQGKGVGGGASLRRGLDGSLKDRTKSNELGSEGHAPAQGRQAAPPHPRQMLTATVVWSLSFRILPNTGSVSHSWRFRVCLHPESERGTWGT